MNPLLLASGSHRSNVRTLCSYPTPPPPTPPSKFEGSVPSYARVSTTQERYNVYLLYRTYGTASDCCYVKVEKQKREPLFSRILSSFPFPPLFPNAMRWPMPIPSSFYHFPGHTCSKGILIPLSIPFPSKREIRGIKEGQSLVPEKCTRKAGVVHCGANPDH